MVNGEEWKEAMKKDGRRGSVEQASLKGSQRIPHAEQTRPKPISLNHLITNEDIQMSSGELLSLRHFHRM